MDDKAHLGECGERFRLLGRLEAAGFHAIIDLIPELEAPHRLPCDKIK